MSHVFPWLRQAPISSLFYIQSQVAREMREEPSILRTDAQPPIPKQGSTLRHLITNIGSTAQTILVNPEKMAC